MFSQGNSFQKIIRLVIDILNVVLGIAVVVFAVLAFVNTEKNMWMFQYIFLMGGAMNIITGIKYLMTDRLVQGISVEVIGVVLLGISFASHIAIGG